MESYLRKYSRSVKYLESVIGSKGGVAADVRQKVNEVCKVLGAVKRMVKNRRLGMNVKRVLYGKAIVPTVMYGSELLEMKLTERQKLNVFEMKYLRCMAWVSRLDKVRNEVVKVRERAKNRSEWQPIVTSEVAAVGDSEPETPFVVDNGGGWAVAP
ncbi:uncharacterized protein [Palaemon carinicauda]|uniref:uncharacterized protein n=1 Tax=Palaemon carinicauda TaxID=392227 RepID=UPI0035B676A8